MFIKALQNENVETLRALHDLRANMNLFCQNPDVEDFRNNILRAYDFLLTDDIRREKINEMIHANIIKEISPTDFNYIQFKPTDNEAKSLQKSANESKGKNKEADEICKQIKEEMAHKATKSPEFSGLEDAEINSVSLNKNIITVQIKGRKDPISFACHINKGKIISPVWWWYKTQKQQSVKMGLTKKVFEILKNCGEQGYVVQKFDAPENLGKKYSPSEYRKLLGPIAGKELTSRQKNELEILNKLTASEQNKFIAALKKHIILLKKYRKIAEFVTNTEDKLGLLANPKPLQDLLKQHELDDFSGKMQIKLISFIQKYKDVWSNFSKNPEENNQRFSQYEILQNNIIAGNKDIFRQAFEGDFSDSTTVKHNISKCFTEVRRLSVPNLLDELCAEIIAQGIFKEAVNKNTDADKLAKMNLLLNEFGINIDFKSLPVTKAPPAEIATAAEQNEIDRQNFKDLKRGDEYLANQTEFLDILNRKNIVKTDDGSDHHYFALKYNSFINDELNSNRFLVKTYRAHDWNYDGHVITHVFDTAGEFLIKNNNGEYSLADFNRLRNRFNQGEKMEIQVPILQTRNSAGEFEDLLALGNNGKSGYYISDSSTKPVINVPDYCQSGPVYELLYKLEQKKSSQEKK